MKIEKWVIGLYDTKEGKEELAGWVTATLPDNINVVQTGPKSCKITSNLLPHEPELVFHHNIKLNPNQ